MFEFYLNHSHLLLCTGITEGGFKLCVREFIGTSLMMTNAKASRT